VGVWYYLRCYETSTWAWQIWSKTTPASRAPGDDSKTFRVRQPHQTPLATAEAQATTTCDIYNFTPAFRTESHFRIAYMASPIPTGIIRLLPNGKPMNSAGLRWLSSVRSLLPGVQPQQSCCQTGVRDSAQLCDCFPAGFRMIITSGEDLFISSSFCKTSSPPMVSLLVCFPHCLDKDSSSWDVECACHGVCEMLAESDAHRFAYLQYL